MNALPLSVDVLVVGYGPVGATIACLLGQYGVSTLVIDKAPDILMMPRAIALDNEALRILQLAGLEDDAFERRAIPRVRMYSSFAGEFAQIDTCGTLDGHPKLVTFYQPELEQALRERVSTFTHVTTSTSTEMLECTDSSTGVRATLRLADGSSAEVQSRFLVAADGASSSIRKLVGQEFQGSSYIEDWLIVDAQRRDQTLDHIEFSCNPGRPTPHMPAPGMRERWEFMMLPGESREEMEQDSKVRELLAPWGEIENMSIERKAVYRFHARCCSNFRKGHIFLAGDAAHVTPPFVGQGLVAGLRDAANLSWKLAWVLEGRAGEGILDSYDQERRPHAKAMIDLARFMGHLIMPRNAVKAFFVHGSMRLLRVIPHFRAFFDDLKIKPKNEFKRGLFAQTARKRNGLGGTWLPQGLVKSAGGQVSPSDEVLGDGLALLGLGRDPARDLSQQTRDAWLAAGGSFAQINPRGLSAEGPDAHEDLTGALVPGLAKPGWVVAVRPDRTILHDGPIAEAEQITVQSLALLG